MRASAAVRLLAATLLACSACVHADDVPADAQPAASTDPATIPVAEPPQEAAPAPAASGNEPPQHLEDIVVTATKREQSVRKIAGTVNALHGEDLEKIGARELTDYINQVPGITLAEGEYGYNRNFAIRGVGPGDGGNQTTGQFIGDIPLTDPGQTVVLPDLDPFDLRTFEVLKGPQGTTFGATALNGAIRFVPNAPVLGAWEARGFADELGVDQGGRGLTYAGALNAPVGDSLALRGVGVMQHVPGVVDNLQRGTPDADSRRKWSARGMALWQPLERLTINGLFLKQQSHQNDLGASDNDQGRRENNYSPGPSTIDVNFALAALDLRYAFDGSTLVWQSSRSAKSLYAQFDTSRAVEFLANQGVQNLAALATADIVSYTHELRLVSPNEGPWKWTAGLFLQRYRSDQLTDQYVASTSALGTVLSQRPGIEGLASERGISVGGSHAAPIQTEERAAYGDLSRKFGERWELTLGTRYYDTRLHADVDYTGAVILLYYHTTSSLHHYDQSERGFSPKASLVFQITPDVLTYATVARGFQFGGVNTYVALVPTDSIPPTYRSSTLWSYESGIRTDWFDRTLRMDLTAFYIDWSDAQLQLTTPTLVETPYFDNVGKVHSKGLEGSLAWLTPVPGLSLNVAGSYILAKTAADYTNGTQHVPAGTDMGAAPHWQTAETLAYTQYFGSWITSASLNHTYTGHAWNNIFHAFDIYNYSQYGLNLSVARPDWFASPSLALGITNLTNVDAVIGHSQAGAATAAGNVRATGPNVIYNRPRAINLRLSAEFR
ncbi:MAG TPA: TonB-dependent receptor [Nevskiaceae bacterium]|nr:TonB-dependent receptor [Nevskiaceae bacterium]